MIRQYLLLILFGLLMPLAGCSHQPVYPAASQSGTNIVVEASSLKPGVPVFFTHRSQGKNISFFVLKTDNKVLAFFDACGTCYPHKRGYRYAEGRVICRACDQEFPINKLEKGLGNCFPIKLEGKVVNGKYLIPISALEAEAGKF